MRALSCAHPGRKRSAHTERARHRCCRSTRWCFKLGPCRASPITHRYRKAYEDYARALHQEYPHIKFQGNTFHPGDAKMALAQVFQMCFFAGIVLAMGAKKFLPEHLRAVIDEYPLPCMMLVFMCNMASGAMLNSGAFEVKGPTAPATSPIGSLARSLTVRLHSQPRAPAVRRRDHLRHGCPPSR